MASHSTRIFLAAALLTAFSLVGCGSKDKGKADAEASKPRTPMQVDCARAMAIVEPHNSGLHKYETWASEENSKKGAELTRKTIADAPTFTGSDEGTKKRFATYIDVLTKLAPAFEEMQTAMADATKTTTEIAAAKQDGGMVKAEEQKRVSAMLSANGTAQAKLAPFITAQRNAYADLVKYCVQ